MTISIANPATETQSYSVQLLVNGEATDKAEGTLPDGASKRLVFRTAHEKPGGYEVSAGPLTGIFQVVAEAKIVLRDLDVTPRTVGREGDAVAISAVVANEGDAPGVYSFDLLVNGTREATVSGAVRPGESIPLLFGVTRAEAGLYEVVLGPLSGAFNVVPLVNSTVKTEITLSDRARGKGVDDTGKTIEIPAVANKATKITATEVEIPLRLPPGATLQSFEDPSTGAKLEGDTWTIPVKDGEGKTRMGLVVKTEGLTGTGTSVRGRVSSVTLKTFPVEVDLSGLNTAVGKVIATLEAKLNSLPSSAVLTMAAKDDLPPDARSVVEPIAQASKETVAEVGASLWVRSEDLPNGPQGVGQVNICLGVGQAWANQHAGASIRMAHLSTDAAGNPVNRIVAAIRQPSLDAGGRVIYCAETSGLSFFALLAVQNIPADVTVRNLTIQPSIARLGEALTITAEVVNAGGKEATLSLPLRVNGQAVVTETVTVGAGATKVAQFVQKAGADGVHTVEIAQLKSSFEVQRALTQADVRLGGMRIIPERVRPGQLVTVTLTAENLSQARGYYEVPLLINGGMQGSRRVSLEPGKSTPVEFQLVRTEPFTYQASVGSLTSSFTVDPAALGASFTVVDLRAEPVEAAAGAPVAITALVENTSEAAGTYAADLEVRGPQGVVKETLAQPLDALTRVPLALEKGFTALGDYEVVLGDKRVAFRVVAAAPISLPDTPEAADRGSGLLLVVAAAVLAALAAGGSLVLRSRRRAA